MPLVSFYTPWKHQKTKGFLMFSRGIERDREMKWVKNRWDIFTVFSLTLLFMISDYLSYITQSYITWKHQKTFGGIPFRGYRKRLVAWNELTRLNGLTYWLMMTLDVENSRSNHRRCSVRKMFRPTTLLKRDSDTGVFLWSLQKF